jgi:hypothetical protein
MVTVAAQRKLDHAGKGGQTSDSILVRRLDLGDDNLRGKRPKNDHSKDHLGGVIESCDANWRKRTCVPQTAIAISYFSFASLGYVKDCDAEPEIIQDSVCVFFVDLSNERVVDGCAEVGWLDGYGVL